MRRIISFLIGFGILAFIINTQVESIDKVLEIQVNANWKWALISIIFFLIHGFIVFLAWAQSLKYHDLNIEKRNVMSIHFISLISRYLPGGIWHIAGRLISLVNKGFDVRKVLSTLYLEQIIAILSCLGLVMAFYWYRPSIYSELTAISFVKWSILFSGCLITFLVLPNLLTTLPNFILSLLNKGKIQFLLRSQYYKLFFFHILSLLLYAIGYYFAARVYMPSPDITLLVAIIIFATLVGFLAIFVPSGLGIREGIFIAYLNQQGIEGSIAISIALLPRLLIISAEFFSVGIALWGTNEFKQVT